MTATKLRLIQPHSLVGDITGLNMLVFPCHGMESCPWRVPLYEKVILTEMQFNQIFSTFGLFGDSAQPVFLCVLKIVVWELLFGLPSACSSRRFGWPMDMLICVSIIHGILPGKRIAVTCHFQFLFGWVQGGAVFTVLTWA